MKLFLILLIIMTPSVIFSMMMVPISEISSSGQTLTLEIGMDDGLEEGSFLVLIGPGENQNQNDFTEFKVLSTAKIVKSNFRQAMAVSPTPIKSYEMFPNKSLLVVTENMMKGRSKIKIAKKMRVFTPESLSKKYPLPVWARGEIDSFNKEVDNQVVYGNITTREREIYLPEFDQIVSVISISRQKEGKANEWQNTKKRRARLENLVKGSVGKMNKRKQKLKFYQDVDSFDQRIAVNSSFDDFIERYDKIDKKSKDPKNISKPYLDPLWSAEMSDKELRKFFLNKNKTEEKFRQELGSSHLPGSEIKLRFQYSLRNHSTELDNNFQAAGNGIYGGWVWHLMNVSSSLRFFGLEVGVEMSENSYEFINGTNGQSEEVEGRVMFNLFINELPSVVRKFVWFVGGGMKFGIATLSAPTINKDIEYTKLTLASVIAGVRYRIRAGDDGISIPIGLGWEASFLAEHSKFSSREEVTGNAKGNFDAIEMKANFGLNIYF